VFHHIKFVIDCDQSVGRFAGMSTPRNWRTLRNGSQLNQELARLAGETAQDTGARFDRIKNLEAPSGRLSANCTSFRWSTSSPGGRSRC
jgi:hypothetical protein